MVNLTLYRELQEAKSQVMAFVEEVNAEFAEKEAVIAEAKRVALERRIISAGLQLPEIIDDRIEKEREALLDAALKNFEETGKKTLEAEGGKISVTERDKCITISSDTWDADGGPESTGLSYTQAVFADIRTLYGADMLEHLKINASVALAKAIPSMLAKGHGALLTVDAVKTQSATIKLDK